MRIRGFFTPQILRAPENDDGAEFNEADDYVQEDELPDPDEELGDADEGDEAGGSLDQAGRGNGQDDHGDEEVPEVRRGSRAQARVEQALREAREAKERLAAYEREREAERSRRSVEESSRQRAERLAMMDPDERAQYLVQEADQRHRNEIQQLRFEMQDAADRSAFESLAARNPAAAKYRDDVEQKLREMRAAGTTAPRETILAFVIGQRALENAGKAKGKATRQAAVNRQAQTGRPAGSRSDVRTGSSRSTDERTARRNRLADLEI